DVPFRARFVWLGEGDVAVRIDEGGGLRRPEEGKCEGHRDARAVVVGERLPIAERGAEAGVGAGDVVAAGVVSGKAKPEVPQVVGIGRQNEVALVLNDGDVADVRTRARRRQPSTRSAVVAGLAAA